MNDILSSAIDCVKKAPLSFAKFLSPNDTGLTGAHQCGIYIPQESRSLIFETKFRKGENHDRWADIIWNDVETTHSRFVYYGQGTRNEYRITNFGHGFKWLKPEHTGDLAVICKENENSYCAFILSKEDEIESFLETFSIAPTQLNRIVNRADKSQANEDEILDTYLLDFNGEFPSTTVMALSAEEADRALHGDPAEESPDKTLVRRIDVEYRLFRRMEDKYYSFVITEPANTLEAFVSTGLEIANRRKSRAGKSLEHHLAAIFDQYDILYTPQATTEGNRKPDFIFPSVDSYHDESFPVGLLTFLGAKTTCKDRWRQVLNEASRISEKYLFTLQQGVSPQQLEEMHEEHLTLVVPCQYHKYYPQTEWKSVISLHDFIGIVLNKQKQSTKSV